MATTTLIACKGARHVTRSELDKIEPPPRTDTWVPVKHSVMIDGVAEVMEKANFHVQDVKMVLSRNNHRLFATIDTATQLNCGSVTLAIGLISSTDRSLAMKFVAGARVLCCANLSLRSDLMEPVRKKHSKNGLDHFQLALRGAVGQLDAFKTAESSRIARAQRTEISNTLAESVILRAFEREVISAPLLPHVLREYREPSFPEFRNGFTLWRLENAFTTVLGDTVARKNPQRFCDLSMELQGFLAEVAQVDGGSAHASMSA